MFGKDGAYELKITAQFPATLELDGKSVCVPVFVQPGSSQQCLLGTSAMPFLGISVVRSNGEYILGSVEADHDVEPVAEQVKPVAEQVMHKVAEHKQVTEHEVKSDGEPEASCDMSEPKVSYVRLVQATTIPGQNGRVIKAQIDAEFERERDMLFEPKHGALDPLGLTTQEALVSVLADGSVLIPIQNFQGVPVKLDEGLELGVARCCELPVELVAARDRVELADVDPKAVPVSTCAAVRTIDVTPERGEQQQLIKLLDLPVGKLNPDELDQLKKLLIRSSDVFALNDNELGCTGLVKHTIDTGDHPPIKQPPYRAPVVYREKIEQTVADMQARGIVKPSMSPWASPIVLVPKKDGSLRFCVDHRCLNTITRKDVYPLPRITDILDTLGDARYFSSLDLASGYWQVELDKDAGPKSAFATHNGLYEFVRMPFGLCNAPATFQRVMQVVLAGLEWHSCFVYIDDVLIASRTFEEHMRHLEEVFERLRRVGLRLKPKKCLLLQDEVTYLGHVISVTGIRPDPMKTEKVKSFPTPDDVSKVRQFIGLASYYRRFVPGFAKIAAPLHNLMKKEVTFSWTPECETAFCRLKEALISAPVLVYPRFGPECEFILETDASYVGLGAVLSQQQEDGRAHPVAYASRSLDPCEKRYGVTELETLGLVWAVRHFRPYLLGHRTTVYTDHSACLSLLNHPRPSGKLARWALTIQEMDLVIKHRAGKANANADALSRNPLRMSGSEPMEEGSCEGKSCVIGMVSSCEKENEDQLSIDGGGTYQTSQPESCECMAKSSQEIRVCQMKDSDLLPYFQYLEDGLLPVDEKDAKKVVLESRKFEVIDGVLQFEHPSNSSRWCTVVPKELRDTLLEEAHAGVFAGHLSEKKVYDRLRRLYWWNGMRTAVRKFCRACLCCASRKGPCRASRPPLTSVPVGGPFHRLGVDLLQLPLTANGNKYVLVFLDYLTKWVEAFAIPDQSAETIARLLVEHVVCRHGVPHELLSDRGANFLSDIIAETCKVLGMKKINTSGYHPQTDGLVEKFNSTLINMLAKGVEGRAQDWDRILPYALFAYRSSVQDSTRETPFYLLYGRDPRLPTQTALDQPRTEYLVDMDDYRTELVSNLSSAWKAANENVGIAQSKQKKYYDLHSKDPKYRVGDRVMVYMPKDVSGKTWKFARPYHGPFRVVSITPTNAEVQLIDGTDPSIFVAIDRLRKCYPEQLDTSWVGGKKKRKKKKRSKEITVDGGSPGDVSTRTEGPVTRSMTRRPQNSD